MVIQKTCLDWFSRKP